MRKRFDQALHMRISGRSMQASRRERGRATLEALTAEGDCVLDFSLEQDSYDSEHSKTNQVTQC